MTDLVQKVTSVPVQIRTPVPRPDPIAEPVAASQGSNKASNDQLPGQAEKSAAESMPSAKKLTISKGGTFGQFVYRSIEPETGEVVWQYPAEALLRHAQQAEHRQTVSAGTQVDTKA